MGRLTAKQGATLVKLARYSIESYLQSASDSGSGCSDCSSGAHEKICEHLGCFDSAALGLVEASQDKELVKKSAAYVTVRSHSSKESMAEHGSHHPSRSLAEEVANSSFAVAEAIAKLGNGGISGAVLEISILSQEKMRTEEYQKLFRKGKDGVLVKYGKAEASILPMAAAEQNYSAKDLLVSACEKAGLPGSMWSSRTLEVHKLSAQVFAEKEPNGTIFEKKVMA